MKRLKNLKSNKGSVLFIVLAIMTVMVALAAATFFTVHSAGRSINTEYMNEQAYQAGNSVNELVYESISLGTGNNALRQKVLSLIENTSDDTLNNVALDTEFKAINGYEIVGVTIKRISREQFLITCSVQKDGEIQTVEMSKELGDIVKLCKVYVELTVDDTPIDGDTTTPEIDPIPLTLDYYAGEQVFFFSANENLSSYIGGNFIDIYNPPVFKDANGNEYKDENSLPIVPVLSGTGSYFFMPDGDVTMTLSLRSGTPSAVSSTLTFNVEPNGTGTVTAKYSTGGIINSGENVLEGKSIVFTFTPAADYCFDMVSADNGTAITQSGNTFNMTMPSMNTDVTFKAKLNSFTLDYTNLKFKTDSSSNPSVASFIKIKTPTDTDFRQITSDTLEPDTQVKIITGNDDYIIKNPEYQISDGAKNVYAEAFKMTDNAKLYGIICKISTLTLKDTDTDHGNYASATTVGGAVFTNGGKAAEGDEVVLTITPEAGYKVTGINIGGNIITLPTAVGTRVYTFNMPNVDTNVEVIYEALPFTVTEHWDSSKDSGFSGRNEGKYGLILSAVTGSNIDYSTNDQHTEIDCGKEVKFTIFSSAPYAIRDNWGSIFNRINIVEDTDGNQIDVSPDYTEYDEEHNWKTTYTFTMPAKNVKINYSFQVANYAILIFNGNSSHNKPTYSTPASLFNPFETARSLDFTTYSGNVEKKDVIGSTVPRANYNDIVTLKWSSSTHRLMKYTRYYIRENDAGNDIKYAFDGYGILTGNEYSLDVSPSTGTFSMPYSSVVVVGTFNQSFPVSFNGRTFFEELDYADVKIVLSDESDNLLETVDTRTASDDSTSLRVAEKNKLEIRLYPKKGYDLISEPSSLSCNGTDIALTESTERKAGTEIDEKVFIGTYQIPEGTSGTIDFIVTPKEYTFTPYSENGNKVYAESTGKIGETVKILYTVNSAENYIFCPKLLNGENGITITKHQGSGAGWAPTTNPDETFVYASFTLTKEIVTAFADNDNKIDITKIVSAASAFKRLYPLTITNVNGTEITSGTVEYSIDGASWVAYITSNKKIPLNATVQLRDTSGSDFIISEIATTDTAQHTFTMPSAATTVKMLYKHTITLNVTKPDNTAVSVTLTTPTNPSGDEKELSATETTYNNTYYYYDGESASLTVTPDGTYLKALVNISGVKDGAVSNKTLKSSDTFPFSAPLSGDTTVTVDFSPRTKYDITVFTDDQRSASYAPYGLTDWKTKITKAEDGDTVYVKREYFLIAGYEVSGMQIKDTEGNVLTAAITYYDKSGNILTKSNGVYDGFSYASFTMPACAIKVYPLVGSVAITPHDPNPTPDPIPNLPETFVSNLQNTAGKTYADYEGVDIELPSQPATNVIQGQSVLSPLSIAAAAGGNNTLDRPMIDSSIFSNGDLILDQPGAFNNSTNEIEINVLGSLTVSGAHSKDLSNKGTIRVLEDFTHSCGNFKYGSDSNRMNIYVIGDAEFIASTVIYGDLYVGGNITTSGGQIQVKGNLYVGGNAVIKSDLQANNANIIGTLTQNGGMLDIQNSGSYYASNYPTEKARNGKNVDAATIAAILKRSFEEGAGEVGKTYNKNLDRTYKSDKFETANEENYKKHTKEYDDKSANCDDCQASTRDIIYYTCVSEEAQTLWNPIHLVPDTNITLSNSTASSGTSQSFGNYKCYITKSGNNITVNSAANNDDQMRYYYIDQGGSLTVETNSGSQNKPNAIIIDTSNGTDNDPTDDKDIYLRLTPNVASKTGGAKDTFKWNLGTAINTNVFVKGAGSVIFVIDRNTSYSANTKDFVGHLGWLNQVSSTGNLTCDFGNISMFKSGDWENFVSKNVRNMVDSYSNIYNISNKVDGDQTYLLYYEPSENTKKALSDSKAANYYMHNNIFLVEGFENKTTETDNDLPEKSNITFEGPSSGGTSARFMGYIYAPQKHFISNGSGDSGIFMVGGLVAYDYSIKSADGNTLQNSRKFLYTTPFDQYRIGGDGNYISINLMGLLIQRAVEAERIYYLGQ